MNAISGIRLPRRAFLQAGAATALTGSAASAAGGRGSFLSDAPGRCIVIANSGGMSHIDLWDPKPDAPVHVRGEFAPIATSVPGILISELLPRTAQIADRLAIVRSVTHTETDHRYAALKMASLNAEPAATAKLRTTVAAGSGLSGFVSGSHDTPEDIRSGYGRTRLGQALLTARRRIEAGEPIVHVDNGHWDTHGRGALCLREILAPAFDQAFAALIGDLAQRGLLATTRVIVTTEFGRTPEVNSLGGRDHWPAAFSIVMAGAGVEPGVVIGRTDRRGAEVADQPLHPDLPQRALLLTRIPPG